MHNTSVSTSMADGEFSPLRGERETFRGMEMLNVLHLSSSVKRMLRQLYKHVFKGIATYHEFR